MFDPFVISQPDDNYRIQIRKSQIIGFEIHKKHDSNEFYIHTVIVGGATGPGGLYSNKTKAESVAKEFMEYISGRSSLEGDFQFPDYEDIKEKDK